jgi:hypothetical protein
MVEGIRRIDVMVYSVLICIILVQLWLLNLVANRDVFLSSFAFGGQAFIGLLTLIGALPVWSLQKTGGEASLFLKLAPWIYLLVGIIPLLMFVWPPNPSH